MQPKLLSWLSNSAKRLVGTENSQVRFREMSREELSAVDQSRLDSAAQQSYRIEVGVRDECVGLSDEDLLAKARVTLDPVVRDSCRKEIERRRIGYFVVRVTNRLPQGKTFFPKLCARCGGPGITKELALKSDYVVTHRYATLTGTKSVRKDYTAKWDVPVCADCEGLFDQDGEDFIRVKSKHVVVDQRGPLGRIVGELVDGEFVVQHSFSFTNYVFGSQLKRLNSPVSACRGCGSKVGEPYATCPSCKVGDPLRPYAFAAVSTWASYECSGCHQPVVSNALSCGHCSTKQPLRV